MQKKHFKILNSKYSQLKIRDDAFRICDVIKELEEVPEEAFFIDQI